MRSGGVIQQVLTRGGKALVLIGYAHSFTKFSTPSRSPICTDPPLLPTPPSQMVACVSLTV